MFGAGGALSVSLGITLVYTLGALFHWKVVSLVCGVIPILIVLVFGLVLPETPNWLFVHGEAEKAEEVRTRQVERKKIKAKERSRETELGVLASVSLCTRSEKNDEKCFSSWRECVEAWWWRIATR